MQDIFEKYAIAPDAEPRGFLVRDLVRFLAVDIIIIILLKLLLGIGFFPGPDAYVLAVLASKLVLAAYLVWLVHVKRSAWPETGIQTPGRWAVWPLLLLAYVPFNLFLVWFGGVNNTLLHHLYALAGWQYQPEPQDVMLLLFTNVLAPHTRLLLVVFTLLFGPLMEELAFRGLGMDAFRREGGRASALVLTSFLFGLYHFSLQTLIPLSFMGALFGVARLASRSLWLPVALHCVHNAVALIVTAKELGVLEYFLNLNNFF